MERENEINDELKEIAPGIPHKNSNLPPDGYFDSFPDAVLNRWRKEESQPIARSIEWKRIIGIAAILTGLIIGGWWFFSKQNISQSNAITAMEAYQYIHENIDEFEGLIETEEITVDEHQLDIPTEAIEEYLLEEMEGAEAEDLF